MAVVCPSVTDRAACNVPGVLLKSRPDGKGGGLKKKKKKGRRKQAMVS